LPDLVEMIVGLDVLDDSTTGWGTRLAVHAYTGVLRVMIGKLRRADGWPDGVVKVLEGLRRSLVAKKGSLVISQGPPEIVGLMGAWGTSQSTAVFASRIREVFDPTSILSQGRLPQ
jgi:hypothetical protein